MEDIASPENNQEMVEAVKLLEKIAENPYEYETHTAYIAILRNAGATDDLRQAREVFHSFFPFSEGILPTLTGLLTYEELWIQWLEDEERNASKENVVEILDLYDRAVKDYLCMFE
jgi:hypothetical protein